MTLGTSAYEALANGAVDFTLEVYTWEGVKAELEGVTQRAFRYADYGVPDEHTTLIGSSEAWLDEHPDTAPRSWRQPSGAMPMPSSTPARRPTS